MPTPCARDGKGPGHQYGLPDLVEPGGTRHGLLPTPTAVAYGSNRSLSAGATRRPSLAALVGQLLPTPRASDGAKGCPAQRGSHGDLTLPAAAVRIPQPLLPTPRASDGRGPGRHGTGGPDLRTTIAGLGVPDPHRWGVYAAAVARWEQLLGRQVPTPTQPGRHSKPVLAPRFVEWLMGLPDGWVTGLDLPRTQALKVLGNGVVPAQAAAALRLLLCANTAGIPR